MNDFESTLTKFSEESAELQKRTRQLKAEEQIFIQKFTGFLKEQGLPEEFTLPELALLAVRKTKPA